MSNYITKVRIGEAGCYFLCRLEGASSSEQDFRQEIDTAREKCGAVHSEIIVDVYYGGEAVVSAISVDLDRQRGWLECIHFFLLKQGYTANDFDLLTD